MNKISILIVLVIGLVTFQSCEDYLDVKRAVIETEEKDIFGSYNEYQNYLSLMYSCVSEAMYGPAGGDQNNGNNFAGLPNTYSDEIRPWGETLHEAMYGDVSSFTRTFADPREQVNATWKRWWPNAWKAVRTANVAIDKIDLLQDATEEQRNVILGQAYMGRALIYKYMLELWGGMPYLRKPMSSEDDFDIPRLSYYETAMNIVADCDTAAMYLPARWDSGDPVGNDFNNTENTARYTSVAAKALKSRILLYAASPFCNEGGDVSRWQEAAKASWEAIEFATQNAYSLLPMDKYYDNFYGQYYTSETILKITRASAQNVGPLTRSYGSTYNPSAFANTFHNAQLCGVGVYQAAVDRFEAVRKDASGNIVKALPIDVAESEGWFNPQNPYANRDPRFEKNIHYHGKKIPTANKKGQLNYQDIYKCGVIDMQEGSLFRKQGLTNSNIRNNLTGYYVAKFWNGAVRSAVGVEYTTPTIWPAIRMSELYLNYAEAAAHAFGGANGKYSGASLTAVQALNVVRNRANMPDLDSRFNGNQEFLDRVLNERAVELCFEDVHRFIDVRRYKQIETDKYLNQYKISITRDLTKNIALYPTGFKFEKVFLERKPEGMKYYFFPIPKDDLDKTNLFGQNPGY